MKHIEACPPYIYLKPGEAFFSAEPALVTTVLGSCISILMYCKRLSAGGICHALLPRNADGENELRYVDSSARRMVKIMEHFGASPAELEVKLFGGASIFVPRERHKRKIWNVGEQNAKAALDAVRELGLKLTASDLGGAGGRRIYFHTHTNRVLVKRLNGSAASGQSALSAPAYGGSRCR